MAHITGSIRIEGWFRTLGPLVGLLGHRMEHQIWTGLKHKLEATTAS